MSMQQEMNSEYQNMINSLMNHDFKNTEKLAVSYLKSNSLDAQVWLYLAEALAFQGFGKSAQKVFHRALLLDPQAVWVQEAERDIKNADLGKERKDIEELLKVKDVTVTVAIIIKNEEKRIEKCLENLVKAVDEIVIVDTGSTDNTMDIAKKYPKVKIVQFEWCDDFSAARNAAFPHITSDWVLWVDSDEYLYQDDIEDVKVAAGIFDNVDAPILLRIGQMNQTDSNEVIGNYDMNRMFSTRYPFRFYSRIHEQVKLEGTDMYAPSKSITRPIKIRVLHDGYIKSVMQQKDKLERNIKLLEKMVEENPGNPAWLFFYGRELYTVGRVDEGIEVLLKSEECSKDYPNFGRLLDIHMFLVNAYLVKQDLDKAEEVCLRSMEVRNDYPDILYAYAYIKVHKAYRFLNEAELHAEKAKESFGTYRDIVSPDESIQRWKADLLLADISLYKGNISKAVSVYRNSLEVSPAKDGINNKLEFIKSEAIRINEILK